MYCGYITTIKNLRKHSNADRLLCVEVFGNNVIVDLSYAEGDKVVFFPVDGQLSEEYATENNLVIKKDESGNNIGGYLEPNKRNIKALKLRGEKSEGLIMPLGSLSKYTDISKLNEGDTITVLGGVEICRKYIPVKNKSTSRNFDMQKTKVNEYPLFMEHAETEQLTYNKEAFKEGDICYITLKMHGTSGRTSNTIKREEHTNFIRKLLHKPAIIKESYEVVSGSRRVVIKDNDGGYYESNEFRLKYNEFLKDKLPKNLEIFYEIVGWDSENNTIMAQVDNKKVKDKEFIKMYGDTTTFSYGCNKGENDIYVYRMTLCNQDGFTIEIPWEEVQILSEKMGLKCVPTFEKFIFTTWEDLMERVEKYYDGADPIGKTHIREGVVVRIDNREKFTAFKHKNFHFKVLSGIAVDSLSEKDLENMSEDVINEL